MIVALFVIATTINPVGLPRNAEPILCSVVELRRNPDGYQWPVTRIEQFVDEAPVIVRARATGVAAEGDESKYWSTVRFEVLEVIRGSLAESEVKFPGRLVEEDDFNPGTVPYQMVRPSGQRGDCYARDYRVGAEYLFLLKGEEGSLTPHWDRVTLS